MRTYQSIDGDWIATDDAGRKVRAATANAAEAAYMAEVENFAVEYETRLRAVVVKAREIVKEVTDLDADKAPNGYDALVAATPAGDLIDGSTLTPEIAVGIGAVFTSFLAWMETPIAAAGDMTPAQLLRRRF